MAAEPGERRRREAGKALACATLLVGAPLFVAYVWLCGDAYGCAISGPPLDVVDLTVLLVHRVHRDDRRCREKYGAACTAQCDASTIAADLGYQGTGG